MIETSEVFLGLMHNPHIVILSVAKNTCTHCVQCGVSLIIGNAGYQC